mmetsp:Transcript_70073/g.121302  ORF Transcript_70073/g.121302 Transcript_70073/m.121302 type:complete len:231 (-) Transcript_70073:38-730(-)
MPGMYGEPHSDPTHGVARWRGFGLRRQKDANRPPRGALNSKEYDEKHGRWWIEKKEVWRPKLYSTIGRHARDPKLDHLLCRWVMNTPGWKRLVRDAYRKRWPKYSQLCVGFFAEFALKNFSQRTLLETASTLPLNGVGCKFFRGAREDSPDTEGKYFVPSFVDFRQRPIRGAMSGTQFMLGRPIKSNIAAVGKSAGSWRYELPADGHPAVYRPPFPEMRSAKRAAADASE